MRRIKEAIALYRIYLARSTRHCGLHAWRGCSPGTDMKHLIRHYIGAWRLARINNTRLGVLRELLRPVPF